MTICYMQVQSPPDQLQQFQPAYQPQLPHQNPFDQPTQTTQNSFDFHPHQQNQQRRRVKPDLILRNKHGNFKFQRGGILKLRKIM